MISPQNTDYDNVMTILQVAALAFNGLQVPKSEILAPFADHITIALIAMTNDREEAEIALHETIKYMKDTFNDYWDGNLDKAPPFNLN